MKREKESEGRGARVTFMHRRNIVGKKKRIKRVKDLDKTRTSYRLTDAHPSTFTSTLTLAPTTTPAPTPTSGSRE